MASPTNLFGTAVNFVDDTYRVTVNALPWRGYPQFVGAVLVAVDRPIGQMGNYHLAAGANSPATTAGPRQRPSAAPPAPSTAPRSTSTTRLARSQNGGFDIGSDERQ